MKLALTSWNGRISPVFDVARQVLVCEIEGGRVIARHQAALPIGDPQAKVRRLCELGAQALVCGAVSRPVAAMLADSGIRVDSFTAGGVDDVLAAWLEGRLPDPAMDMPGCCGRRRQCGRGRGRRAGGRGWGGVAMLAARDAASETGIEQEGAP